MFKAVTDYDEAVLLRDAGLLYWCVAMNPSRDIFLDRCSGYWCQQGKEQEIKKHWLPRGEYAIRLED